MSAKRGAAQNCKLEYNMLLYSLVMHFQQSFWEFSYNCLTYYVTQWTHFKITVHIQYVILISTQMIKLLHAMISIDSITANQVLSKPHLYTKLQWGASVAVPSIWKTALRCLQRISNYISLALIWLSRLKLIVWILKNNFKHVMYYLEANVILFHSCSPKLSFKTGLISFSHFGWCLWT